MFVCFLLLLLLATASQTTAAGFVPGDGTVSVYLFGLFIHISMAVMSVAKHCIRRPSCLKFTRHDGNNILMPGVFFVRPGIPEVEGGDGVFVSFK